MQISYRYNSTEVCHIAAAIGVLLLCAMMSVCHAEESNEDTNRYPDSRQATLRTEDLRRALIEAQQRNAPEEELQAILNQLKHANQVAQETYKSIPGQNGELRPAD